jgi:RHS repeat-associated protein
MTTTRSRISNLASLITYGLFSIFASTASGQTYEWAVTYISGYQWHPTPLAAVEAYRDKYEVTAGCASSGCTCEIVIFEVNTYPRYREKLRCWFHSSGSVINVQTGNTSQRVAQTQAEYYVSDESPPSAENDACCENGVGDPIDPRSGAMYLRLTDIKPSGGPLKFERFYNSSEKSTTRLSTGWRHSYSRSVTPIGNFLQFRPWPTAVGGKSSKYSTASAACLQGFQEIRAGIPGWETGVTSFGSDNRCTVSVNGAAAGSIRVSGNIHPAPNLTPYAYELKRDDGRTIQFNVEGGVPVAPRGSTLRLNFVSGGFQVIDEDDNIELYNSGGRLLSITTRAGVVMTMTYTNDRITQVADSYGRKLIITYSNKNQVASIKDANNQLVQYSYDIAGRLSTVTQTDNSVVTFLYEDPNFPDIVTGRKDENSALVASWSYDAMGRAISVSEANGVNGNTITYNGRHSATVVDSLGATRTFSFTRQGDRYVVSGISGSKCPTCKESEETTYDVNGFVNGRRDYNGNLTTYVNDPVTGLELSRTEAQGTAVERTITTTWHPHFRLPTSITEGTRTITFTHDATGNVLTRTITDASAIPSVSRTWTYTYDSSGKVLTEDGPRADVSDVTTYSYYNCITGIQCGQIQSITNALQHSTTFNNYNAHGDPTLITDANGRQISIAYDFRRRIISYTLGAGGASPLLTSVTYWPTGLLRKLTNPDSSYIEYFYDAAHRLTEVRDGVQNRIVYTLDAAGNVTAENVFDADNQLRRTHTRVFNALSQLEQDVNAAGTSAVTTFFGYDDNGNQTSTNAPLGRDSTSLYDELNRLRRITDPGSGLTLFGYDNHDNLTSVTDPRSLVTNYSYNGFGELTEQNSPDTGVTTNTYDAAGNLDTSTDSRGVVTDYEYDADDRVTSVSFALAGVVDQTINYGYDAGTNQKGRLTSAWDADHTLAWTYDVHGRVTGKGQSIGNTTLAIGYGYDAVGRLGNVTLPSGNLVAFGYNLSGEVTSLTLNGGTTILSNITYDPFGPITGWIWGNGTSASRGFDTDGKITQVDNANGASLKNYAYDDAFRITGITDVANSALSWTYGYDLLDRLNSATSASVTQGWTYDANGNRLTETGGAPSTYTNSATSNRLNAISGALARSYGYDAAGNTLAYAGATFTYNNRGRMATASNGGVTAAYTYNALGQRIRRTASSGTTLYVYDESGHLIGEYAADGALIQETVWLGDMPVVTLRPNGSGGVSVFYVHTDHLNTPRLITDAANNVRWRWDSDAFGATMPNENPTSLGSFVYNLRFPGQQFDAVVGLHYNYFRDYDPESGRFVSSDPIGLLAGINTYAYVGASPLMRADKFGLIDIEIPGATGELTVHANPGRDVIVDAAARAEHGPAHIHLGRNDGPRVRIKDFLPYSEDDARKMTPKQLKFCKGLDNKTKNLIRKRAKSVYKRGFFWVLFNGQLVKSTARIAGPFAALASYAENFSDVRACEYDPDLDACPGDDIFD